MSTPDIEAKGLEAEKLLPCPFCGRDDSEDNATQSGAVYFDRFRGAHGGMAIRVACCCGASGKAVDCATRLPGYAEAEAVAAWNRRSPVSSSTGDDLDDLVMRTRVRALKLESDEPEDKVVLKGSELLHLASALTAEREARQKLDREVNRYAYERDKAREERDKAEARSEAFWKPRIATLEARVAAALSGIEALVPEDCDPADDTDNQAGFRNAIEQAAQLVRRSLTGDKTDGK